MTTEPTATKAPSALPQPETAEPSLLARMFEPHALGWIAVVASLIFWEAIVYALDLNPIYLPRPAQILLALGTMFSSGGLLTDLLVTLGRISHASTLAALDQRRSAAPFGHGTCHDIGRLRIFVSYHCSRYNTNTGVLTPQMFRAVFKSVRDYLDR